MRVIERFVERFAPYGFEPRRDQARLRARGSDADGDAHRRRRTCQLRALAPWRPSPVSATIDVSRHRLLRRTAPPLRTRRNRSDLRRQRAARISISGWSTSTTASSKTTTSAARSRSPARVCRPAIGAVTVPSTSSRQSGLRTGDIGFFHKGELYRRRADQEHHHSQRREPQRAAARARDRRRARSAAQRDLGHRQRCAPRSRARDGDPRRRPEGRPRRARSRGQRSASCTCRCRWKTWSSCPEARCPAPRAARSSTRAFARCLSDGRITIFARIALTPMPPAPRMWCSISSRSMRSGRHATSSTRMARRQGVTVDDHRFDASHSRSRIRLARSLRAGGDDRGKDRARYQRGSAGHDPNRRRPARTDRTSCRRCRDGDRADERDGADREPHQPDSTD